jgi:hypothetical protein
MAFMTMHACNECVSTLDTVDKLLLTQEVEGAIYSNRRWPRTAIRQSVD